MVRGLTECHFKKILILLFAILARRFAGLTTNLTIEEDKHTKLSCEIEQLG